MTRINFLTLFQVLLCLLIFTFSASAQITTVYNNFGEDHDGWDYDYTLGWTVSGDSVEQQFGAQQAMSFDCMTDGYLTDIWLGFFYVPISNLPDTVTVRITPNLGSPPSIDDVMEEWVITDFTSWTQWDPPVHLEGNGSTLLELGSSYWIWAVGSENTWTGWCMNSDHTLTCLHTMRREGEDWLASSFETASAFRVDVDEDINIDDNNFTVTDYKIMTAYPNPFNPSTNLSYSLDKPAHVNLTVYDALGRQTAVLENGFKQAGNYENVFKAINLPAGNYFAVLHAGQLSTTSRIVLIK